MSKRMQFYAMHFPLYEPGNTKHELVNIGDCVRIISMVTRLHFVIPSVLGSI